MSLIPSPFPQFLTSETNIMASFGGYLSRTILSIYNPVWQNFQWTIRCLVIYVLFVANDSDLWSLGYLIRFNCTSPDNIGMYGSETEPCV